MHDCIIHAGQKGSLKFRAVGKTFNPCNTSFVQNLPLWTNSVILNLDNGGFDQ